MKKNFLFFGILLLISIGSHAQMYVDVSISQPGVDECLKASVSTFKNIEFVKIHPNPAKDLVKMSWENPAILGLTSVDIYNQTGQKVLSYKVNSESIKNTEINVSHLIKGIYSLQIYNEKFKSVQKLIIE